jgi:hypothetical protein
MRDGEVKVSMMAICKGRSPVSGWTGGELAMMGQFDEPALHRGHSHKTP